jgi:predicted AAA+ superfamily ATPase
MSLDVARIIDYYKIKSYINRSCEMYISRILENHISRASDAFPALIVTGPRQVGKTTTLRRLAGAERKYVTLDDPLARDAAARDPAGFVERYYNAGRRPPVCYYRDADGREVDLLLDANGTLFPIEIKKTASPRRSDTRHFAALRRGGKPVGEGSLVSMYRDVVPLGDGNWTAPIWVV